MFFLIIDLGHNRISLFLFSFRSFLFHLLLFHFFIFSRFKGGIFARKMPNILEPKWVTGDFGIPLSEFVVDCGNLSDREAVGKRGREAFDKHGIVWFRNSGLTSPDDMASLARMVLKKEMKYEGGSNPRSSIKGSFSWDLCCLILHVNISF